MTRAYPPPLCAAVLLGLGSVATAQAAEHTYSAAELQTLKAAADQELEQCLIATAVEVDDESQEAALIAKTVVANCRNEVRESGFYYAYAQLGNADAAAQFARRLPASHDTEQIAANIVMTVRKVRHEKDSVAR
jgi:hypothetical protein